MDKVNYRMVDFNDWEGRFIDNFHSYFNDAFIDVVFIQRTQ